MTETHQEVQQPNTLAFELTPKDVWIIRDALKQLDAEVSQEVVTALVAVTMFGRKATIYVSDRR